MSGLIPTNHTIFAAGLEPFETHFISTNLDAESGRLIDVILTADGCTMFWVISRDLIVCSHRKKKNLLVLKL